MKVRQSVILCCMAAVLCGNFHATAQTRRRPQALPDDPAVVCGRFDCGIDWYFVSNKKVAGVADFALLQRDTLLKWRNVPLFAGDDILDIVTIEIFRKMCENPYRQVLIAAGDFNVDVLKQKMKLLSLMVTAKEPYSFRHDDDFLMHEGVKFKIRDGKVTAGFSSERISEDLMNTGMPLSSRKMDQIFEYICMKTLEKSLDRASIPVKSMNFTAVREEDHFGPNNYTIEVTPVQKQDAEAVGAILEDILAATGTGKTPLASLQSARSHANTANRYLYLNQTSYNSDYIDRCLAHERFGTSLATNLTKLDFISRAIPDSTALNIFNRYSGRLLTGLTQSSDSVLFFSINSRDTLVFHSVAPTKKKAPAPKVGKDTSTDGILWTFKNGIKVSYKKMTTGGLIYYGVYPAMPELSQEEEDLLSMAGFTQNCFPSDKLTLFLRTLGYLTGGSMDKNTVIVLIGDRSEDSVLKTCREYMGNFFTSRLWDSGYENFDPGEMFLDRLCELMTTSWSDEPGLSERNLERCKTVLINQITAQRQSPLYWLGCASARYSYGKNVNSDFAGRIRKITLEDVRERINSTSR